MVGFARQSQYGFPVKLPRSNFTQERVLPTHGYTDLPDIPAGPASVISGTNCWLWQERVTPRPRLQAIGQNILSDVPTGAFTYFDVSGDQFPMLFSRSTAAYLSANTWTPLTYVSGVSNNPPTGGQNDRVFGTETYLPRLDANIAVWVNGVNPAFVWGGPSNGTAYSTMTQGYIAHDVTIANNRLIYWNVEYLSSNSQLVTRVVWTAAGNPEDTTGIDTGYQDLLDMRGAGTRAFTVADQLIVATDQELWRATFVGQPYVYQFTPLSRAQGIPFARAAINTPEGLFWLGSDDMVYNVPPFYWYSKIDPVGVAVQRTLHNQLADPTTAFFGYHADAKMLSLYYTDTAGQSPNRALTYHTLGKQWMPQNFAQKLVVGFQAPQGTASSATTWGGLVGPLTGNQLTYNQLLGFSFSPNVTTEAVASSAGSTYVMVHPTQQPSDDGQTVTSIAEFGPMFTALPERRKFCDEARLSIQCDTSNTTLSCTIAGFTSSTNSSTAVLALSQGSTSSQYRVKSGGISDVYHNITVSGNTGSWNLMAITGRAMIEGEAI